jgi:hypothetical protein
MKNIISIFSFLLFFLFFNFKLSAEILFLKTGQVIYGTIVTESDKSIKFIEKKKKKSKNIPRKNILRILYKDAVLEKMFIYKKDGSFLRGYIVDENSSEIIIRENLNKYKEKKISRSDISSISEKEIKKKSLFYDFELKSKAKSAAIEGDFTGWRQELMNRKSNADDTWEKKLEIDILKKNEYQYRYIIDNQPTDKKFIKFKIKQGKLIEDIDLYKLTFGLRAGGGMYTSGYAKDLSPSQPLISGIGRINLPFIWEKMGIQAEGNYFNHELKKNKTISDLSIEVNNYLVGGFIIFDFNLGLGFALHPKIGGGYVFQNINITGEEKKKLSNSFPMFGGGLEISYEINRFLDVVLNMQNFTELEKGKMTLLNSASLGLNFRL